MIAYRLRYEPFNKKVIELCQKKELGAIKLIEASNCQNVSAPNIRLSHELGGGPVGDVGIYCLNAARYITGEEPIEVTSFERRPEDDPRFREVPETVTFSLRFPDGVMAHCGCSFGTAENRYYRVVCDKGVIELDKAFGYRGQQLSLHTAEGLVQMPIEPLNHFSAEMDHFSQCILNGKEPRTPGSEGLADQHVIEAIGKAASSKQAVLLRS
jgi:predicted dehydrogenase